MKCWPSSFFSFLGLLSMLPTVFFPLLLPVYFGSIKCIFQLFCSIGMVSKRWLFVFVLIVHLKPTLLFRNQLHLYLRYLCVSLKNVVCIYSLHKLEEKPVPVVLSTCFFFIFIHFALNLPCFGRTFLPLEMLLLGCNTAALLPLSTSLSRNWNTNSRRNIARASSLYLNCWVCVWYYCKKRKRKFNTVVRMHS